MQSQSPLLGLPAELRNQIYELVLGGELLHVDQDIYGFNITICQSQSAEMNAYKRFLNPSIDERAKIHGKYSLEDYFTVGDEYHVDPCSSRHNPKGCYNFKTPSLHLSLLRVCKQIYDETRLVPYSANTFGFESSDVFNLYISTLTPSKRSALGRLHFTRTIPATGMSEFKSPDPPLTGLRYLHLSLENWPSSHPECSKASLIEPNNTDTWIRDFLLLDRRLLKKVTVIVSDYLYTVKTFREEFPPFKSPEWLFDDWLEKRERLFLTANQKRDLAERIRTRLLKP